MAVTPVRALVLLFWVTPAVVSAHDGPPFPIVSDRRAGGYIVSVWTDPDTTDDGSAGGQFWVMLARAEGGAPVPDDTTVRVTAVPLDRAGASVSEKASPVRTQPDTQFAALVLDHEGRFDVQVDIEGSAGRAAVTSEVDATYDLRPPPIMLLLYLTPFLAVGVLWAKLLLRRRGVSRAAAAATPRRGRARDS